MPKQLPLSEKRRKWVGQFKPKYMRGNPLNPNAAAIARYYIRLASMIERMSKGYEKAITKFFDEPHTEEYFAMDATVSAQAKFLTSELGRMYESLFALEAKDLASYAIEDADKSSRHALGASLKELSGGLALKVDFSTGDVADILGASVTENVGLIKSIAEKYHTQVQGAVMRSITTGNGLADLVPFLAKQKDITLRRARIIANDQTRKAFTALNSARMQKSGVRQFEWLHSAGGRTPRRLHERMSGKIYSFDDLPVIDLKTGERGIPGQLINCRCRMIPIINFNEGRTDG